MNWLFIANWVSGEVVQALCWTLLHSLWQGLVMAAAAGFIVMRTRKSSAALRYNLLSALFVVFVATVCFTLVRQLNIADHNIVTGAFNLSPSIVQASAQAAGNEIVFPQTYIDNLGAFFDRHAMLVVAIWFIILSIKCTSILMGIGYMQHIRYNKTRPVNSYWAEKLALLASRVQVSRQVVLLESGIVKVPMVVGFLKPAILVPIGLLANLPPSQVENILLHELAHIRRKDYLINILQSLTEMIFFFNPAVVWVSSLIREERENCCDDLAIAGSQDKMNYVNTLVSFQEYYLNMPAVAAVGFAGSKYPLLDRIRRIVSNDNKKLNFMQRVVLVFSIVIITVIALVPKGGAQAQTIKPDVTVNRVMTTDNGNKTTRLVEAHDNSGTKYRIVSVNKVITEFAVNDKNLSVESAFNYKDVIQKIDNQLEAKQQQEAQEAKLRQQKQDEDWNKAREAGLKEQKDAAEKKKAREEKDARDWEAARQAGLKDQQQQEERKKARELKDAQDWEAARQAGIKDHQEQLQKRKAYEETLDKIAADLVREHILARAGDLSSFSLGRGEFIVNGEKQSFDTYNRFKARYIKSPDDYFRYNFDAKRPVE